MTIAHRMTDRMCKRVLLMVRVFKRSKKSPRLERDGEARYANLTLAVCHDCDLSALAEGTTPAASFLRLVQS